MEIQPVDHLVAAVLTGDRGRVEVLLGRDRDLGHSRNMFGVAPIHAAHFSGRPDLVAMLRRPDHADNFYLSAELGELETVEVAVATDRSLVTGCDRSGATALHGACYWGQTSVAELLVREGADVCVPTTDAFLQIAPLGSAIATTPGVPQPSDSEETVLALVKLLLAKGADPNHRRRDGMTALHTAAWRGLAAVARKLVEAGADIGASAASGPHTGESPAASALSQGHLVLASDLDPERPDA